MNDHFFGIINRKLAKQIFHYGLFGIIRNSLGYSIYLLVTYNGVNPKIVMSFLYVTGATVGFLGNRKLIFAHKGSLAGAGVRYLTTHFFGYLINLTILVVMVDKLGYPHQLVQVIAIFVVAGFLFFAFKFFVFGEEKVKLPNKGGGE
jgi:putative flippase GtrA